MKKTRKWPSLIVAAFTVLSFGACTDWGQMDPPAGADVYPKLEQVAGFNFDEELSPESIQLFAYPEGDIPEVFDDPSFKKVLHLNKGYARVFNPLASRKVQDGVSLTFWVKQVCPVSTVEGENGTEEVKEKQDLTGALIAFENANSTQRMFITANGWLKFEAVNGEYEHNNPETVQTGMLTADEWHYVAIAVTNKGYSIYVDGQNKIEHTENNFDCSKIVQFMAQAPYLYIGYGADDPTGEMYIDDLNIYRNTLTSKEISTPKKGSTGGGDTGEELYEPIYFNDFEQGAGTCTIYGGGSIMDKGGKFGKVFSNAMDGMRTNYLKLPSDVLSQGAETQALTIGVWVNRGNETVSSHYMWSPLFTAYGSEPNPANTNPMLACQYRGVLQVNCDGWSDYTDAQNVNGANKLYHDATDWLADGQWHYYTATFTPTTAKVYFDGEIVNEWEIDGTANTAAGLFKSGSQLTHICLGGNQAWDWGDPDPGFWFDDIAIYNHELSQKQIKRIIAQKGCVYFNDFEFEDPNTTIVGGGSFIDSGDKAFGKIFSNAMDGMRANYLLLPQDILSHSVESKALSIAVWVNRGNETTASHYMWSPLFTAYGAGPATDNAAPMLACQYRGVLQVNCAGWSDYTDEQNVNGVNGVYHDATDWLADGKWHLYTAIFTPLTAKVYFDGELKNSWVIDGTANTAAGLFSNGADLKYICLGGNQAWNWGDPDPGFWFDDFAIYNRELTENEILGIVNSKK